MTGDEARGELLERELLQRVFCANEDGSIALSIILNLCGYYATQPGAVCPELVALANTLLWKMGIYGSASDASGMIEQAKSLTRNATTDDLKKIIKEDKNA